MFQVDTPQGTRYMIQLVGPASYRMGAVIAYRGQTLTVSKRTRDYLVRKTSGAWVDFDPTPEEPVQEYFPPQFGEPNGPAIDTADLDPKLNPPMSLNHAMQLAQGGGEVAGNVHGAVPIPVEDEGGIDPDDLAQKPSGAPEGVDEQGDLSSADVKPKATGGAAKKPAGGNKGSGVKITTKATPKPAEPASDEVATTIS